MSSLLNRCINIGRHYGKFLRTWDNPKPLQCAHRLISNVQYEEVDEKKDEIISKDVIEKVNEQLLNNEQGRLFAVVHVAGKQYKITKGDLIIVEGYWPPDIGDKINLNKVLLVGAKNFSLIGRPVIQRGLVDVHTTVIEKCLSHTKTNFKKKRRKQYTNINFYRIPQTMLRINEISITGKINETPDVTELDYTVL